MDLRSLVKELDLTVKCGDDLLNAVVTGGYVGDLLSDVIANSREGQVWITRQNHQNIIAVASLKGIAGIILVQGTEPTPDTLDKATNEGVALMVTQLSAFEVVGKIFILLKKEGNH